MEGLQGFLWLKHAVLIALPAWFQRTVRSIRSIDVGACIKTTLEDCCFWAVYILVFGSPIALFAFLCFTFGMKEVLLVFVLLCALGHCVYKCFTMSPEERMKLAEETAHMHIPTFEEEKRVVQRYYGENISEHFVHRLYRSLKANHVI